MLGFKKKIAQVTQGITTTSPAEAVEPLGEIFTMPTQPSSKIVLSKSGNNRQIWLGITLGVILVAAAGFGIYLAFGGSNNSTNDTLSVTPPVNPSTPEAPSTPPPPVTVPSTTPAERDRARYADITSLQSALQLYYADNNKYPLAPQLLPLGSPTVSTLNSGGFGTQVSGTVYLAKVPQNPQPGAIDYLYQSNDGSTYTIKFQLESGAGGLSAGDHQLTPEGIDSTGTGLTAPPPDETPLSQTQPPPATADKDQDGLTDIEEKIFSTDDSKPDSDTDGYLDGREVGNGYDPAQPGEAKLADSAALTRYNNTKFFYNLLYPKNWVARAVDAEESEVMLKGEETGEFIEVLVVDNPDKLSAQAWYAKNIPGLTPEAVPTLSSAGQTWALSLDGLNAYLATDRYLITLSYNIATRTDQSYPNLFKAMVKSFIYTPTIDNASDTNN